MVRSLRLLPLLLVIGLASPVRAEPLAPGGGPTIGWLSLNLIDLSEPLELAGLPQLEPGLFLSGLSYAGERRGRLALGGLAAYGTTGAARLEKSVRLALQLTGLTLEYGEEAREQLGLFVGGLVAPASLTLEVTLRPAGDFDSGLSKSSGTSLTREFVAFELYAGGEWSFRAQRLRLSLGYLWAGATTNWQADGRDFPGPVESFSGPLVQVAFIFGI